MGEIAALFFVLNIHPNDKLLQNARILYNTTIYDTATIIFLLRQVEIPR